MRNNGDIKSSNVPKISNRAGDIFGLQFISKDKGISFTNWYAKTVWRLQALDISDLLKYITTKDQEIKIWYYIGPTIIYLNPSQFSKLAELETLQLKSLLLNSKYSWFEPNDKLTLENGAILFEGEIIEISLISEEIKTGKEYTIKYIIYKANLWSNQL